MTTDSITVSARYLAVGDVIAGTTSSYDRINGATVTYVDTTVTPGLVYVRIDGHPGPRADMIFGHGDPVRIIRAVDERAELEADLDAAERAANGPGASGILYR